MPYKIVANIAALEQLAPAPGDTVLVQAYLKPRDEGGGLFSWDGASTQAPDRGTIIAPLPVPPQGRWKRLWHGPLNIRWFGAQGDGSDDYAALKAAAAALTTMGGGTLLFPPGRYRIDQYKVARLPQPGPGVIIVNPNVQSNGVTDIIYSNCTELHIIGYGATIDVKGDFHRTADYVRNGDTVSCSASVQPFVFSGCTNFTLEGFELCGNVDKMTRDQNVVEGSGSGVIAGNTCRQYRFTDLHVHSFETDGLMLGSDDNPADRDAALWNVRSLFNARNAMSIVNLRGATFVRCSFSQTGRAHGCYGFHPPGDGLNIEREHLADVETGDFTFLECEFVNNANGGLAASTGEESLFNRCVFWGTGAPGVTTAYSIFSLTAAQNLVFEECEIYGECLNWVGPPKVPPKYLRCRFEDKDYPQMTGTPLTITIPAFRQVACVATSGGTVDLESCRVVANKTKGLYLDGPSAVSGMTPQHVVRNTVIIHKDDQLPNHDFQSLLSDCLIDNVHFEEDIKITANRWYIAVTNPEIVGNVYDDGPFVTWADGSVGPYP